MFGEVSRWVDAYRARVEAKGALHDLAYPWWIPTFSAVGQIGFVIAAAAQRDILTSPTALLPIGLVVVPHLVQFLTRAWIPWWLVAVLGLAGVTWLMAGYPVVAGPVDTAAAVLAIVVAEVAATDGPKVGLGVTVASILLLVTTGRLDPVVYHLFEVLFGYVVGCMLSWQMRALAAERAARAGEHDRATLAERQRIAREIHDLVGHSLSVTLLHVTGARRALREDRDRDDIDDAVAALSDAERVGRRAMADIRRTVGMLATGREDSRPLPTATDIDQLVSDMRAAGLDVDYEATGDLISLPPAVGLGIFRVVQESLANVARHAPSTPARVRLDMTSGRARVRVANRLPVKSPHPAPSGEGSGIAGMASRAEQLGGTLHAGPEHGQWLVDMMVPTEPHPAELRS